MKHAWQRFLRQVRRSPYGVRGDGTPILPAEESTQNRPGYDVPPEAVVFSGPLTAWAQDEIDRILDERGLGQK